MTKDEIRKSILAKRNGLSQDDIREKSIRIFNRIVSMDDYEKADNILIYASMGSEVRTDEIILDALSKGKNVFCPKCTDTKNGIMEFIRISDIEDLKEGYYGIREPVFDSGAEIFELTSSELMDGFPVSEIKDTKAQEIRKVCDDVMLIMPLVAFDDENNRIGYKGGYYDRFLARFPELIDRSFAIAFEIQRAEDVIPAQNYDIKFKQIITEDR